MLRLNAIYLIPPPPNSFSKQKRKEREKESRRKRRKAMDGSSITLLDVSVLAWPSLSSPSPAVARNTYFHLFGVRFVSLVSVPIS